MDTGASQPALGRIRQRRDFLLAAKARKAAFPSLILQARNRRDTDPSVRAGFTASKKVGNAVARNRAKRRLRAVASEVLTARGLIGHDYVLIARRESTDATPYDVMKSHLLQAVEKLSRDREKR